MFKTQISYVIYELTEDGLLKRPKDDYGYNEFKECTTMDEALKELEKANYYADYIILTQVSRVFDYEKGENAND